MVPCRAAYFGGARSSAVVIDPRGLVFFFNDTATTEIYTLSLHDALPISRTRGRLLRRGRWPGDLGSGGAPTAPRRRTPGDRKSTRLNSSYSSISYAVLCLKKKRQSSADIITKHWTLPNQRRRTKSGGQFG